MPQTKDAGPRTGLADLATDIAGIAGAASVTWGAYLVYHPAAFIVGGLFLLAAAWLNGRRNAADEAGE